MMCWTAIELECGHIVLKTQTVCCEKLLGFEYIEPVNCFLCDTELFLSNFTLSTFCKRKLSIKPWYKVVFTGYAQNADEAEDVNTPVHVMYDNYGNPMEVTPPPKPKGKKHWTQERLEEFLMWEISLSRVVDLAKEKEKEPVS